ncbi:MAG: shikimate kinase [Mycobacteriales bacterium]
MSGSRLLLVGMMGAGKTTTGRLLEARTGWPYLDNDELLARATGVSTPELLARDGVAQLRRAESAALCAAVQAQPPLIAAVAAGVVDDPADRVLLRAAGVVVYLRARLETLAARVGAGPARPWLGEDPLGALKRLYAGREEHFQQVATLVVDVDALAPAAVCEQVFCMLRELDVVERK